MITDTGSKLSHRGARNTSWQGQTSLTSQGAEKPKENLKRYDTTSFKNRQGGNLQANKNKFFWTSAPEQN